MSLIFSNAEWIASSDLALLGSAYESTRIALQREAGLTDADLDTLTDVMGDALLSLYRAGQVNETRLTNYAVAKTLRHISAGQRIAKKRWPSSSWQPTPSTSSSQARSPTLICNGERCDANPVELKQIKGPEAERRIIFAVIHQRSEARQAGVVTGNELAINDGGFCRDEIDHGVNAEPRNGVEVGRTH